MRQKTAKLLNKFVNYVNRGQATKTSQRKFKRYYRDLNVNERTELLAKIREQLNAKKTA